MEDERQLQRRVNELNINLYLTLNYVMTSEHLKYSARNFMVFYNVSVAFVGLNNNTILAKQNIEFDIQIRQIMPVSRFKVQGSRFVYSSHTKLYRV